MGALRAAITAIVLGLLAMPAAVAEEGGADTISPDLLRLKERQRRVEGLTELFARQTRIYRLSYPLLYAAVDLCPNTVRSAGGFTYANAYMFRGAVRSAASDLGYSLRVSVVDVVERSAGAAAGIRPRDVILAIDDWPAPFGEGAVTLTAAKLRDTFDREGRARLTLKRGGVELGVRLKPDFICDLQVLAAPGVGRIAYTDGARVVVFHGMMDFTDDEELAAVVAREIANALIPVLNIDAESGGDFSLSNFFEWGMEQETSSNSPTGNRADAKDFGLAADYVAAYLLARAGFNHRKGAAFWRRLAATGNTERYGMRGEIELARLEAAAQEIDAKLAARRLLVPQPLP